MKKFSTVLCCISLMLYGAFLGFNNPAPMNTISAEVPTLELPRDLCRLVHDTVTNTVRDTVYQTKVKRVYKYRKVVVRDTVKHEIPVLYTRTTGTRKEFSPDTLLQSSPKRVRREVIELNDNSETR